jgi:hypothetical protein
MLPQFDPLNNSFIIVLIIGVDLQRASASPMVGWAELNGGKILLQPVEEVFFFVILSVAKNLRSKIMNELSGSSSPAR